MSQLFKQKYFCQICDRQCRDKDGFNCHMNSNTHKLNMERVAQNPEEYINNYSLQFEKDFLDLLKRSSNSNFVSANRVYQEYITDKTATHMNATRWTTLSEFINYLQLKGKIEVRQVKDSKDLLIKLVQLDPDIKLKIDKKIKDRKREEIKFHTDFRKIKNLTAINLNTKVAPKDDLVTQFNSLETSEGENVNHFNQTSETEKIEFSFKINDSKLNTKNAIKKPDFLQKKRHKNDSVYQNEIINISKGGTFVELSSESRLDDSKKKLSLVYETEMDFDLLNIPWISENLLVKINDINLSAYYQKTAKVKTVSNDFLAEVEINENDKPTYIRIDQAYLSPTIVDNISSIKILFGANKNEICQLECLSGKFARVIFKDGSRIKIKIDHICSYEQ
jgi:DNA/RNA-binding protein KIN17